MEMMPLRAILAAVPLPRLPQGTLVEGFLQLTVSSFNALEIVLSRSCYFGWVERLWKVSYLFDDPFKSNVNLLLRVAVL